LSGADLSGADLSGAVGLLVALDYLERSFEWTRAGMLAYKTFGSQYQPPASWIIKATSVISEVVNPDRCTYCACGVNVGTATWILNNTPAQPPDETVIWQVLIRNRWLPGIVVPYMTDGKVRCERVELVKTVTRDELMEVTVKGDDNG